MGEFIPDIEKINYCYYNPHHDSIEMYTTIFEDLKFESNLPLPLIKTEEVQVAIDVIEKWLHPDNQKSFLLVGPPGCGKRYNLVHRFVYSY